MELTRSNTQPKTVLVIEDEEPIREGLLLLFEQQGFSVAGAADGLSGLEHVLTRSFDLVVLDLMLPKMFGLDVLKRVRGEGNQVPVLVLTARGAEDDIVAGLEAGADDYVTKPFGVKELVARAQGLLRRSQSAPEAPQKVRVGPASLDFDLLRIEWPDGQISLTAREGLLLQYLSSLRHRPVSREDLLVDVWGYRDGSMQTRTVDVHIQQLRAKVSAIPGGKDWIQTVRGRGYRFAAEVE